MEPQKLKRVVIKEELVAICGNYIQAILLNQLIYWSERTRDFDLFMKQEAKLEGREPDKCFFGWIYKSYNELAEETMIGLSPSNIKKHVEKLSEKGLIEIRQNKNKWDRRKEYKINLKFIQNELLKNGYSLEGYSLGYTFSKTENGISKTENRTEQNRKTVTEITTEITTENNIPPEGEGRFDENSDEMILTEFFIDKLIGLSPRIRVPDTNAKKQKWAKEFDKILRLDKRDRREVCKVIIFALSDSFWKSNILSPGKLRKQYDTLYVKMISNNKKPDNRSDFTYTDADNTAEMLARRRAERREIDAQQDNAS